jgi:hypothetical protein
MIPEEEENTMRPISKWSFQTGAAVLIATLLLGLFAVLPARADLMLDDPAITPGYSAAVIGSNGGTETTNMWSYATNVQIGGSTSVSFLNNTGFNWTTLEIVAHYTNTSAHTYTAYVSPSVANLPSGATTAFSAFTKGTTSNTVTFDLSGPPAVPNGNYLVFTWTNWNTNGSSVLSGFDFEANGGAAPVPEPGTLLLLGAGLVGLVGFRRKFKA